VPVVGKVCVSMKAPELVTQALEASVEASGL
jgi:hypothetical protein